MTPTPPPCPPRPSERGFGLLEMLIAATIAGLAFLLHAGSLVAGHRMAESQETRTIALQTMREFMARARSDEDWAGLYGRLRVRQATAAAAGLAGHALTAYYPDLEVPSALGDARMLVKVPVHLAMAEGESTPTPELREDAQDPLLGLPYDLNGDGVVDDQPHDADYRVIPAVFVLTWTTHGESPQQLRVSTWLHGER